MWHRICLKSKIQKEDWAVCVFWRLPAHFSPGLLNTAMIAWIVFNYSCIWGLLFHALDDLMNHPWLTASYEELFKSHIERPETICNWHNIVRIPQTKDLVPKTAMPIRLIQSKFVIWLLNVKVELIGYWMALLAYCFSAVDSKRMRIHNFTHSKYYNKTKRGEHLSLSI